MQDRESSPAKTSVLTTMLRHHTVNNMPSTVNNSICADVGRQVAMQLHKLRPQKNPYYFWAVMSIVMQACIHYILLADI